MFSALTMERKHVHVQTGTHTQLCSCLISRAHAFGLNSEIVHSACHHIMPAGMHSSSSITPEYGGSIMPEYMYILHTTTGTASSHMQGSPHWAIEATLLMHSPYSATL